MLVLTHVLFFISRSKAALIQERVSTSYKELSMPENCSEHDGERNSQPASPPHLKSHLGFSKYSDSFCCLNWFLGLSYENWQLLHY
jgi:hypothetical protein